MAMKQSSRNQQHSSSYGEGVGRQANVLASCYAVDGAGLRGLHYCTTPAAGAECPPLAALTASNELALLPKKRGSSSSRSSASSTTSHVRRREGAALRIREECERFFCETMKAVFRAERNAVGNGSGLTGVYDDNNDNIDYRHINSHSYCHNGQLFTPPNEAGHFPVLSRTSSASSSASTLCHPAAATACSDVAAWLEVWDYAGGASFRGFVAEDPSGAKSLFAFFDAGLMGRDLKQALMALIELADSALGCAHVVICVDRRAPAEDAASLMKGLQWAGFSLTTLDLWTGGAGVDVTSPAWVFMGMEL